MMQEHPKEKFSVGKRLKSFRHAFHGLRFSLLRDHNMRVHVIAAIVAIVAGLILKITAGEWVAIIFSIGFVIAIELVNSAIEMLADFISPGHHHDIGKIKDLAAAAVLVAAITAVGIALFVFVPHVMQLIK